MMPLVLRQHQKLLRSYFSRTASLRSNPYVYHATTRCFSKNGDNSTTKPSASTSWSDLIAARNRSRSSSSNGDRERPSWSDEWKRLGLGADLVEDEHNHNFPRNLFFVQLGFGVDQHGDRRGDGFATKAAVRAVRNAIEFNSIPGVIDHVPGGRKGMILHVKLGVPGEVASSAVDPLEVAKVFPYGKILPIEIVTGGLEFHSGRVVEELGDDDDVGCMPPGFLEAVTVEKVMPRFRCQGRYCRFTDHSQSFPLAARSVAELFCRSSQPT
eukprot:jgi/Psemu1/327292/estExt_fgenesh1_pg.C_6080001